MKKTMAFVIATILIAILAVPVVPAFATAQPAVKNSSSIVDTFSATVTHMDIAYRRGSGRQYVLSYSDGVHSGTLDVSAEEYAKFSVGDVINIWQRDEVSGIVKEHSSEKYVVDIVKDNGKYFVLLSTEETIRVTKGSLNQFSVGADYSNYSYAKDIIKNIVITIVIIAAVLSLVLIGRLVFELSE